VHALDAYRRAAVAAASKEDSLLLLVREAARCAEQATADSERRSAQLDKAARIVAELIESLNVDYGGALAWNLLRLYLFAARRLSDARRGDQAAASDAARVLAAVRAIWEDAVLAARQAAAS
jgi:flagellar biosynthetic protein FliS